VFSEHSHNVTNIIPIAAEIALENNGTKNTKTELVLRVREY